VTTLEDFGCMMTMALYYNDSAIARGSGTETGLLQRTRFRG